MHRTRIQRSLLHQQHIHLDVTLLVGHGNSIICPAAQQDVHQHTNVHVFTVLPVVVLESILPVAVLVKTAILDFLKVKKVKLFVTVAILALLV